MFNKLPCAYTRTLSFLGNCFSNSLSPLPKNNTILKISPPLSRCCMFVYLSRVYRGSSARKSSPRNVRFLRFSFPNPLPLQCVQKEAVAELGWK